jgi:hypothetical protein
MRRGADTCFHFTFALLHFRGETEFSWERKLNSCIIAIYSARDREYCETLKTELYLV